jgi:hypothetical protein
MTVTVCMDEAGAVWIVNGQGAILAECFFKTEDETEDALQHMGYHRLLTVYPAAHLAAGTKLDPAELGEGFSEGGLAARAWPDGRAPARGHPRAEACSRQTAGRVTRSEHLGLP